MLREGMPVPSPQKEQIRRDYISHEASVRAVTTLFLFGACGSAIIAVAGGFGDKLWGGVPGDDSGAEILALVSFFGSLALLNLWVAVSLCRLHRSGRTVAVALAGLGLLMLPFGTIASAYILWLLLSRKGRMVFSDDYRKVINDTPHVSAQTAIVVRVLLLLLFIVIAGFGYWLMT